MQRNETQNGNEIVRSFAAPEIKCKLSTRWITILIVLNFL